MLPHNHFLVAGLAISSVAMIQFPEQSLADAGKWLVIGGVAAAAIDLDIVVLVLMRSRREESLRPFRSLIEIHRRFDRFVDLITNSGVLRTGLITHLFTVTAVAALVFFFAREYFIPVIAGTLSHILTDVQYLRRLSA